MKRLCLDEQNYKLHVYINTNTHCWTASLENSLLVIPWENYGVLFHLGDLFEGAGGGERAGDSGGV